MNDKLNKELFEWVKMIAIWSIVLVLLIQVIRPTVVNGDSMNLALEDGDYLIINQLPQKKQNVKKGDIVVFRTNLEQDNGERKDLIKRVIAIGGDHLKIENSKVYINGNIIKEPYIGDEYTSGYIDEIIPENEIFVMGDNRDDSLDSRYIKIGCINKKDLIGVVLMRVYPFYKIGKVN